MRIVATDDPSLAPGATPGYQQIQYTDLDDLFSQLEALLELSDECIEVLEINAHGNPTVCDKIRDSNAQHVGERLGLLNRLCDNCSIYLSGCNTGLGQGTMFPLPKLLAMSTNCTVYGTVGYMSGTRAEGNAEVTRDFWDDSGQYHPPKPGASGPHNGDACFKPFTRFDRPPGGP